MATVKDLTPQNRQDVLRQLFILRDSGELSDIQLQGAQNAINQFIQAETPTQLPVAPIPGVTATRGKDIVQFPEGPIARALTGGEAFVPSPKELGGGLLSLLKEPDQAGSRFTPQKKP